MVDDFQGNGQIKVLETLEKSWNEPCSFILITSLCQDNGNCLIAGRVVSLFFSRDAGTRVHRNSEVERSEYLIFLKTTFYYKTGLNLIENPF